MSNKNLIVYYRLVALWAACEAMLGGIIHGLRIPISGLVIGSCAVTCISLIAWYYPVRGAILKATLIVAVCKMLLSPQASFPAYIAVFFQGALGELLFRNKKYFPVSCMVLALLSLIESGFQRIAVLTIVYGNELWSTIDAFIGRLAGNYKNYSGWIAGGYLSLHLVTGFIVGKWTASLPARLEKWKQNDLYRIDPDQHYSWAADKVRKRKLSRKIFVIVWLIFLALYVQSYYNIGKPLLPSQVSIKILLRSLIIILGWIYVAGPLFRKMIHYWLRKKQNESQEEIRQVLKLMPAMRQIVSLSLERSRSFRGLKRFKHFSKTVLINTLYERNAAPVYILEGGIQTGKTSSLQAWIRGKDDVHGILTPVKDGKRYFLNVATGEEFAMEADDNEKDVLTVGKYRFIRGNFEKAINVLRSSMEKPGWLIIDEIGPLELRGEGFADVLNKILAHRKNKSLLVIRESLKEAVITHFSVKNFLIFKLPQIKTRTSD